MCRATLPGLLSFVLAALAGVAPLAEPITRAETTSAIVPASDPDTTLRVALFPYLPDAGSDDFVGMVEYVRAAFMRERPGIRLEIRSPADEPWAHYDLDVLEDWLTGDDGYDLIEVDTILLRELVDAGLLARWPLPPGNDDWLPAAAEAVVVDGVVYGVPHLLCGYFVISEHEGVAQSKTADELSERLDGLGTSRVDLVGKFLGSATQPTLYVDAWADAHSDADPAGALDGVLDREVLGELLDLARMCQDGPVNRCMTAGEFFDDDDLPNAATAFFAADSADALIGYSERLHAIISMAREAGRPEPELFIGSAPMGATDRPVLFADAFVLRSEPGREIQEAASAFAAFMNRASTQDTLLMSLDVDQLPDGTRPVPRYLLPATRSAFAAPHVSANRYYRMLSREIEDARALPNSGFWRDRRVIRNAIDGWLQSRLHTSASSGR